MKTPVETLLALQEIDVRFAELERRKGSIPGRRAEATRDLLTLEENRARLKVAVERARLDRRARESELEAQHERRARYESQLNEVKTNVAYSALLTEIQNAKRMIAELEGQILELMAVHEEGEGRISEIDAELHEKRAAVKVELEALAREQAEIDGGLERERARREEFLPAVDGNLLRLYDRLRRANRFPALVALRGQACGACHSRMPPQVVQEIRHGGSLHVCEACGVLAYAEVEAPATEAAS